MIIGPRLKVISDEELNWIHNSSLKILEETGIVFHSSEALEICKKHGVKVEGKTAFFSSEGVENALENCPKKFKWRARNNERSVVVGDEKEKLLIQPNAGSVFIQDLDKGRRLATLQDYTNIIKLCQASEVINLVGSTPVDPSDVSQDDKHLHMMYQTLKNSDKPAIGCPAYGVKIRQMLDMVEIAMGERGFLEQNHCIGVGVDPLSPLAFATDACETIIEYARQKQIVFFPSAVMAGFSGPISLIGTVILQNTEILAGITLAQLINPGNPVGYSVASTVANMKTGNFITASPETMLIQVAGMQMGLDLYKLPTRSMCGMTDSKTPDYQAGYDTMQNLMMGILGGAHIVVECMGVLDFIMTTSYEKFVIDQELLRRVSRIREGIDTSVKEDAVRIIQEMGHEAGYINHRDTLENFRSRWMPSVSNWETYDLWKEAGSESIIEKANRMYKEILSDAPDTLVTPELDEELKAYMGRALKG